MSYLSQFLYNIPLSGEDIILILMFFVFFGVTFFSLSNFFLKNQPNNTSQKKGAIILISICIAILASLGISRNYWVLANFGLIASLAGYALPLIIVFFFFLMVFKVLRKKTGNMFSTVLTIILTWIFLRYLASSSLLNNIPFAISDIIVLLSHASILIIGVIVGIIAVKIKK